MFYYYVRNICNRQSIRYELHYNIIYGITPPPVGR